MLMFMKRCFKYQSLDPIYKLWQAINFYRLCTQCCRRHSTVSPDIHGLPGDFCMSILPVSLNCLYLQAYLFYLKAKKYVEQLFQI